MFSLDVSRNAG
jgi:carbonic anhydrase